MESPSRVIRAVALVPRMKGASSNEMRGEVALTLIPPLAGCGNFGVVH